MVNIYNGFLVGGWATPLKNHGVRHFGWWRSPNWMESHNPFMFQTTNQISVDCIYFYKSIGYMMYDPIDVSVDCQNFHLQNAARNFLPWGTIHTVNWPCAPHFLAPQTKKEMSNRNWEIVPWASSTCSILICPHAH